jgi:hypothetical protein
LKKITLLAFVLLLARAAGADTYSNPDLEFTIQIPARFHPFPPPPGTLAAYATSDPAKGMPDELMTITRLGGTIGREHLKASDIPAQAKGIPFSNISVKTAKWKSFDIDVIAMQGAANGATMATRAAQVPLKREAIQITVGVPLAQEAKADATLSELLATADGPSNWLTQPERTQRMEEGYKRLGMTCGIVLGAAIVGVVVLVKFLRRKPA